MVQFKGEEHETNALHVETIERGRAQTVLLKFQRYGAPIAIDPYSGPKFSPL